MKTRRVKVHGMWRTGTNFLAHVLEENLRNVDVDSNGKHAPHRHLGDDPCDGYVVIHKDPWAWLTSCRRYTMSSFWGRLERTWRRVRGRGWNPWRCARWLNDYVLAYDAWKRALDPDRSVWVAYIDLLVRLEDEIDRIADAVGPVRRADPVRAPSGRMGRGTGVTGEPFDPTYYVDRRFMDEFREEDIEAILDAVRNWGFEDHFEEMPFSLHLGPSERKGT